MRYFWFGLECLVVGAAIAVGMLALVPAESEGAQAPLPRRVDAGALITSEEYTLYWGGEPMSMSLRADGSQKQYSPSTRWEGTWEYDSTSCTLRIVEWSGHPIAPKHWSVTLDAHCRGVTVGDYAPTRVRIERAR